MTTLMSTVPPVVCTSWCVDGSGHTDVDERDEQFCRSSRHVVAVAGQPDERARTVLVHLYRDVTVDPRGETSLEPPHVELAGVGTEDLRLSVGEARALGELLRDLADVAEQWR